MSNAPTPSASPRRARAVIRTLAAVALLAVGAEFALRLTLGLGTPVLIETDPEIEYLLKPDQDLRRFGNRTVTNAFGMRSRPTSTTREVPGEVRILVLGDSVVNGGVLTDHEALATTILERRLATRLGRPVFVGNVSAGSWGPPNHRAYLDRFGWFDADAIVLVLSSTDAADDRRPPPRTGPYPLPTERPWSAIGELVSRYVLPRLVSAGQEIAPPGDADRLDEPEALSHCRDALASLFDEAARREVPIAVLHHWERPEIDAGAPRRGHDLIAEVANAYAVPRFELVEWMRRPDNASTELSALFRDHIHLSETGQRSLADALFDIVRTRLPDAREPPDHDERPRS